MLTSNDLKALVELEKLGEVGENVYLESIPFAVTKVDEGYIALHIMTFPPCIRRFFKPSMEEMKASLAKIALEK